MLRRLTALMAIIAAMMLLVPTTAAAKAPLHGDMDLQFNLGWFFVDPTAPDYVGTITFDGGDTYPMAFFNTGTGKHEGFQTFPVDPVTGLHASELVFFEETWVIYEELEYDFNEDGFLTVFDPGDVLLSGYDRGVSNLHNATYRMNGYVQEANGEFEEWDGRRVHMMGDFEFYPFGLPKFAPGVFRVN